MVTPLMIRNILEAMAVAVESDPGTDPFPLLTIKLGPYRLKCQKHPEALRRRAKKFKAFTAGTKEAREMAAALRWTPETKRKSFSDSFAKELLEDTTLSPEDRRANHAAYVDLYR